MIQTMKICEKCDRIVYTGPKNPDGIHCWNHLRQKEAQTTENTLQCQLGVGTKNQCPNPARAGGLCTKHYQRQYRLRQRGDE